MSFASPRIQSCDSEGRPRGGEAGVRVEESLSTDVSLARRANVHKDWSAQDIWRMEASSSVCLSCLVISRFLASKGEVFKRKRTWKRVI